VLDTILTLDRVPEPRHHDQERGVGERKRRTVPARGVAGEHGEQSQDAHLQEDEGAGPSILATMQLVVERPIRPGDPDQGEDDGERYSPAYRDVLLELVCRLGEDDCVDQVVEALEGADAAVEDGIAMGTRPAPEPALEAVKRRRGVAVSVVRHAVSRPL
jgi:hypothetical protein